jgi:transposase
VPKSTIYFILQKYSNRGDIKSKAGSGKHVKIMTAKEIKLLKNKFDHKDNVSQQKCAKELKFTQQYVSHVLKNNDIKKFKKKKAPYYRNEEAINLVRNVDGFAEHSKTALSLLTMKNISLSETIVNQKIDIFIHRINP